VRRGTRWSLMACLVRSTPPLLDSRRVCMRECKCLCVCVYVLSVAFGVHSTCVLSTSLVFFSSTLIHVPVMSLPVFLSLVMTNTSLSTHTHTPLECACVRVCGCVCMRSNQRPQPHSRHPSRTYSRSSMLWCESVREKAVVHVKHRFAPQITTPLFVYHYYDWRICLLLFATEWVAV
jgi:hypothetical protein